MFFAVVFSLMAAADVLWWRYADRALRRVARHRWQRVLLAVFMAGQLSYLALSLLMPQKVRRSDGPVPAAIHAAAYVWHLLVLPGLGITLLLKQIGVGGA